MPRRSEKGLSFESPAHWIDRSLVVLQAPVTEDDERHLPSRAPNIVITRERVAEGDTLRMRAERALTEYGKQLECFHLLESTTTELGGEPALYMRFAWLSAVGQLEQSITLVSRKEADGEHVVTTFTTSTPRDTAATSRQVFAEILASVAFEDPTSSEPRPRPSRIVPRIEPHVSEMPEIPEIPMPGRAAPRRF
jgi:hypothetical protein